MDKTHSLFIMTDVMKVGKRAFTWSVVATTILWSIGAAALVPLVAQSATCPTLEAGDLFKVPDNTAVYLLNADMKRMYFPNAAVYKTWYADYSGIVTIDNTCVDAYPAPGAAPFGVNYRPGSRLVKLQISPSVYVVEPMNTYRKIGSESIASSLYGSDWATKVSDIADVFWPNYATKGSDLADAALHNGMLVKTAASTDVYSMADGMLKKVDGALPSFMAGDVQTVTQALFDAVELSTGTVTPASVTADPAQSGVAEEPAGETPSGSLSVALAADQPAAATVISDGSTTDSDGGQANISVLKLVFTAGSSADAQVNTLKLKRTGISADTDMENMHLYDGSTRLASNPSVSETFATFTKSSGLFTVSKGSSKTITVKMDMANGISGGKTLVFSLDSAAGVTLSGSGSATGSFPLKGNTVTTANVTDLGKLTWTSSAPSAAGTVDPGTTNFEIWRLQAANTNQDMEVRKIKFTMVGSITATDLKNFSLWVGGTQIGATVTDMESDKTVTFDLTAAPYEIKKGISKLLSLKADVVNGTNRTFRASVQNAWDIVQYDKIYGVETRTNTSSGATATFSVLQPNSSGTGVDYTVNQGTLTQQLASDSPSGNVPDGGTSITLGKFLWTANGEDLKITTLSVSTTVADGTELANTRLLVDGSQVGTTDSSTTAAGQPDSGWGNFGSNFIIKAGKTVTVTIVADLTAAGFTAASGETIIVGFPAGSSNITRMTTGDTASTVGQNANTVTVRSGTVSVAKDASFGDKTAANPTGTVNATQVKVAAFVITAGAGEDVEVSQITLRDDNASICVGTNMQNLTLKNAAGTQLGTTYANPSTTCTTQNSFAFNISPVVTIVNGGQYAVSVYADLKAGLTTATSLLDVSAVTATGKTTGTDATASSQNLSLQTQYIASAGNLLVEVDADTPIASNYLMGATDQTISKFRLSASSTEAVNVTQLVVSARFASGATGTMNNIRLVDAETGTQVGSAASSFSDTVAGTSSPTTTYSHATFTSLSLQIPKGGSKTLALKVDFTTYENAGFSTTGQTLEPTILGRYTGSSGNNPVTATGASSGSSITSVVSNRGSSSIYATIATPANAHSATTTLYRAKLSTAYASDTPSGASSPNSAQTIMKFVITNAANAGSYAATVNFVDISMSTTISQNGGVGATRALTVYKDSLSTTALATSNFLTTQTFGRTRFSDAGFTDVAIASGGSKTFFVTLDTTDAASTENLSVRINSGGVTWTDGVSTSLTVMAQDLPLAFKTFTY